MARKHFRTGDNIKGMILRNGGSALVPGTVTDVTDEQVTVTLNVDGGTPKSYRTNSSGKSDFLLHSCWPATLCGC